MAGRQLRKILGADSTAFFLTVIASALHLSSITVKHETSTLGHIKKFVKLSLKSGDDRLRCDFLARDLEGL